MSNCLKFPWSSLVHLDLSKNELGDDGVWHLAQALWTNKKLKILNIKENNLVNEGFNELIETLNVNMSLTKIILSQNSIKNELKEKVLELTERNWTMKSKIEMPKIKWEAEMLKFHLKQSTRSWESMEDEIGCIQMEKEKRVSEIMGHGDRLTNMMNSDRKKYRSKNNELKVIQEEVSTRDQEL